MRKKIAVLGICFVILLAFLHECQAQNKGYIVASGVGGSGGGPADSMGVLVPTGELVFGDGTRGPDSSPDVTYDAANRRLEVNGASGVTSLLLQFNEAMGAKNSGGTVGRIFTTGGSDDVYIGAVDNFGGRTIIREDGTNRIIIDGGALQFNSYTSSGSFSGTAAGNLAFDASGNVITEAVIGSEPLIIQNTSAPSGTANAVELFAEDVSSSSELKVRDESGNTTTLSPHNFSLIGERSHEMAWSYYSEKDSMAINVDMFRVVQLLEELTGEKLIHIKPIVK